MLPRATKLETCGPCCRAETTTVCSGHAANIAENPRETRRCDAKNAGRKSLSRDRRPSQGEGEKGEGGGGGTKMRRE